MGEPEKFTAEVLDNIRRIREDGDVQGLSRVWLRETTRYKYTYNFRWMGRPIIQLPQDLMAFQEIVWEVKPDLVVETGIAHGGSLVFWASMLEFLGGDGEVIGIDIDIREHNRAAIEAHPLSRRIRLLSGSSTDDGIVARVREAARDRRQVLVVLITNHTHAHVLRELQLYSPLVRKGGYLLVLDTIIEDMPAEFFPDRPWGRGDNPKTAVWEFLKTTDRFQIDNDLESKLLITVAPDGYLKCVGD